MGKEGQLWDDSALISAFDQAISKYKKMHGKEGRENSTGVTGDVNCSTKDAPAVFHASQEDNSIPETVDGGNDNGSHVTVEMGEAENLGAAKGDEVKDLQVPEQHPLGSDSLPYQDQSQYYSSSLDADEYNQLYKQYYELEEQRQNIIQKLQHFSNGQYPNSADASVSGVQWGTNSANQEYQPISQVPCGTMVVSCCPCACPSSMTSCSSLTCPPTSACAGTLCADSTAMIGLGRKLAVEDDIVKTAMGAAERAISTSKDKTSGSTEENNSCSGTEPNGSSETDLSTVLGAWYSAGFYTGKYLTEKHLSKKQQD